MLVCIPLFFYKEKEGGYSVLFPDLNHLAAYGDTLEESMSMTVDCLAGYLYTEMREGNTIPAPTPFDKVDLYCEDDDDWDILEIL